MSFGPSDESININYKSSGVGAAIPSWVWLAGAVGVLLYLKKKG